MPGGEFAANDVAAFLAGGLRQGEAAAVVTSPARWDEILEALDRMGLDATAFAAKGTLSFLDGDRGLDGFLRDGMPDPRLFEHTIGAPLASLCAGGRALRAYGDMVDLLWCLGYGGAALVLEDLWNGLLERLPVRLLCGYSVEAFLGDEEGTGFLGVCSRHDKVERSRLATSCLRPISGG